MTEQEFTEMFVGISSEVADEFYPKGRRTRWRRHDRRRGEYLRDQGVLHFKLVDALRDKGMIDGTDARQGPQRP